ncbi:MAG TPA: hypothetical protein VIG29_16755 [Vicinamibacteria bacterium]
MRSRVGWKTWSAFVLVLGTGVLVFAFLPKWVSERPLPPVSLSVSPAAEPAADPVEPIEPAEPEPQPPPATTTSSIPPEAPGRIVDSPAPPPVQDDGFAAAMSEGLAALSRNDFALAREAFARARAIRPEAADAASGLSQAEEGLRNTAIAAHRDRALELEAVESFRAAEAEYGNALALDPSLRFAQEGKERSAVRALVLEKLEFQLAHPERLSDNRALEEARRLLDEARAAEGEGPKRREAVERLEALVSSYSRPVEVRLLSDQLTEVTLHRVGPLGKFEQKVLELRPGRYVAVGSRPGFRDVRVEFQVEPGGMPVAPIPVRCSEAI